MQLNEPYLIIDLNDDKVIFFVVSFNEKKNFKVLKKIILETAGIHNGRVINIEIVSKLLKKTIILSHHGTAILEATHMGYKSICSVYSLWDQKFNISNQWSKKNQ